MFLQILEYPLGTGPQNRYLSIFSKNPAHTSHAATQFVDALLEQKEFSDVMEDKTNGIDTLEITSDTAKHFISKEFAYHVAWFFERKKKT